MYQLIGINAALRYFALACGAVAVLLILVLKPGDIKGFWSALSVAVTAVASITVLIGQTSLFPKFCKLPLISGVFPDIDGKWKGELDSNWPEIAKRKQLPIGSAGPVAATLVIRARLFFVHITLISDSNYSTSRTVFVRATKHPESGELRLTYVYENSTLKPERTDSAAHHGAAYIDLKDHDTFDGLYWTNRNYHQALNTAGRIVLQRC
ncbi:hypothetical protein GOC46_28935 [Sinorhizobium meliloti]|nr:hypothetical protein [Sinorhizobium meliloti]MDX0384154.1 hypothetical protein [Sinorhizobium meliloti]